MKLQALFISALAVTAILQGCSGSKSDTVSGSPTPMETAETTAESATSATGVTELTDSDTIPVMPQKPIIIDFNATWCGPCREFRRVFEKVASTYSGHATFYSADVDNCPGLASRYGVTSIPHITVITPSGEVKTFNGYMTEEQFSKIITDIVK